MLEESKFQTIVLNFKNLNPILVIGDLGVDKYTYGSVDRISPEAPVPVLKVTKEWSTLGLAANVTNNLAALNVKNTICGIIGDDERGDFLKSLFNQKETSVDGIFKESDRATTFKERVLTNTQQICRVDYESSKDVRPETSQKLIDYLRSNIKNLSAVIIEDYGKGSLTDECTREVIKISNNANVDVFVDPSRNSNPLKYQDAHLIKPNLVEAKLLAKHFGLAQSDDVLLLAKTIKEKLNIKNVVITMGGEGMAILEEGSDKLSIIPTLASEVFDVSGAGDSAISALVASKMAGATLLESAIMANCASGVVVGKKGTATVNQQELIDFYKVMKKKLNL